MLQAILRMPRLNAITAVAIDNTVDEIQPGPAPRGTIRWSSPQEIADGRPHGVSVSPVFDN
jgi:hypothetical protein